LKTFFSYRTGVQRAKPFAGVRDILENFFLVQNGSAEGEALCRGSGCPRKPLSSPPQAAWKQKDLVLSLK